ncbi:hypothetical protein ACMTAU_16855, partial [Alcaligenes pakistanensis]
GLDDDQVRDVCARA